MFLKKCSLVATVVALTALGGCDNPASSQDKIVAKVNGAAITETDMNFADAEIGRDLANLPPEVKRRALAEYLIDNLLFAEAAEAANLEFDQAFKDQMQYIRRRVLRQQYFERNSKSTIDDAEAKKIYDERVSQMKPEQEILARHILVATEEKAKELREQIVAGGDFEALAKENSTNSGSKDKGGLLDYFGKGQMVPEFEAAAFKLVEGGVSEPVKSSFGWHIIKVEDRRQKEVPSYDAVKETIINSLVVRKAQDEATVLRDKAELEYIDVDIKKQVEEQDKKAAAKMGKEPNAQQEPAQPAAEQKPDEPDAAPMPKEPAAEPKADEPPAAP